MCKLCNNNDKPIDVKYRNSRTLKDSSHSFRIAVYDYTQEFPCAKACRIHRGTNNRYPIHDIDDYIVKTLIRNYVPMKTRRLFFALKYKTDIGTPRKRSPYEQITIEPNIRQRTYLLSSFTSYTVRFENQKSRTFKALEEAQQFKQGVLNEDYQHNSVAA